MPPGPMSHGSGQDDHSENFSLIYLKFFGLRYFYQAPVLNKYIAGASSIFKFEKDICFEMTIDRKEPL